MRRVFFEDLVEFYEEQILSFLKEGKAEKAEEVEKDLAKIQADWQDMEVIA